MARQFCPEFRIGLRDRFGRTPVAPLRARTALLGTPGHAQQAQPQTPAPADPPPPAQPSRRDADADQQPPPVFRAGINFVRVDVIVTDKAATRSRISSPRTSKSPKTASAQTIETFKLIELDGGLMPGRDGPPAPDSHRLRRGARGGPRRCAAVRDFPRRLSRHARVQPRRCASRSARFVETQLGPSDMVGLMYPLQPVAAVRMTRNHAAIQRGIEQFRGGSTTTRP